MSPQLLLSPPVSPPPPPGPLMRIEYLDFQNVAEHREFRLRVYGPDGSGTSPSRLAFLMAGSSS